jgi:RinA family phage transcriptional activator
MSNQRIKRANAKMIEAHLYEYKDMTKAIAEMEDDIINSTGPQSTGSSHTAGSVSDTTASRAGMLADNFRLHQYRRMKKAIDCTLTALQTDPEPKKIQMITMKYIDRRYTDFGIIKELPISRRTFYRWRRQTIELIAYYYGCEV